MSVSTLSFQKPEVLAPMPYWSNRTDNKLLQSSVYNKKKVTSIAVGASAAELPQAPCSEEAPPAEPAFTRDHETSAFFHFYQFDQFILPLIFSTLSPRKYATNGSSLIKWNEVCRIQHLAPARSRVFSQPSGITHADNAWLRETNYPHRLR